MNKGFSLIETIIFAVLLSFILTGFVQYSYMIYQSDFRLFNKIQDEGNFGSN